MTTAAQITPSSGDEDEVPVSRVSNGDPSSTPTYTIIQADGLYPDSTLEDQIFTDSPTHKYRIKYLQTNLWPPGTPNMKPWSSISEDLRHQVNGILDLKLPFTAEDVKLFPNLKVFIRMGVGYDRLDRPALDAAGVTVCNVPDYGTNEIADHALALTLALRRGVLLHNERQRQPYVDPWMYIDTPLVARLQQKTFSILGLGRIGSAAALRAKAFGFNVLFYDPYVPNGTDKSFQIERTKVIKELFRRANVLSIHCPCTRETRGFIDYDLLSLMPKGSVLVNTARGEVLQLDAVERALKENILAGAGLDVLPEEPIPEPAHSLIRAYRKKEEWLQGRMVLTCHTAFYSPESFVDIRVKSAETMRNVLIDGGKDNVITVDME